MTQSPLAADRCAVVVVDMQNDYCHPEGALAKLGADVGSAARVGARITALLDVARAAGVPCLHVRTEHSPWTDTPEWLARGEAADMLDPRRYPIVAQGSWGAQPYGVAVDDADRVIVKHRYSGFAYTSLELSLRARQRDVVVLAGVTSDVCVRATAFDAIIHGFRPVLVRDGTTSTSAERNTSAIQEFASHLGRVLDVEDLAKQWQQPGVAGS
jgi:ureidoacrylate peracid hydrolase